MIRTLKRNSGTSSGSIWIRVGIAFDGDFVLFVVFLRNTLHIDDIFAVSLQKRRPLRTERIVKIRRLRSPHEHRPQRKEQRHQLALKGTRDIRVILYAKVALYLNRRQPRFSGIQPTGNDDHQ
jgi:hypothetical protein